jgi:hypothetical protein
MKNAFPLSLLVVATLGTLNCFTCKNQSTNPAAHSAHCTKHAVNGLKEDVREIAGAMDKDYQEAKDRAQHSEFANNVKQVTQKVTDKAKEVGNTVKNSVCDACGATKKAGINAKNTAKDVATSVKDTAIKIGHAIKDGASDVKDTASEAKDKAKRS